MFSRKDHLRSRSEADPKQTCIFVYIKSDTLFKCSVKYPVYIIFIIGACEPPQTHAPVSRARSSPVPGVVAYGKRPITARTAPHVTCRMQFPAVPEVVVWDHGRKNKDNVMII